MEVNLDFSMMAGGLSGLAYGRGRAPGRLVDGYDVALPAHRHGGTYQLTPTPPS